MYVQVNDDEDEHEDDEEAQERQVQWQRAHRFLSVIAKWKKTGHRPRAFSDPELFASFTESEKRQIRKENMTLI